MTKTLLALAALSVFAGPAHYSQGSSSSTEVKLGPVLPAGSSQSFQEACLAMEERLHEGDFEGARKVYRILPKLSITMGWDDSMVPAALRASFAEARDRAIESWVKGLPGLEIKAAPARKDAIPPQILVSFVDSIPPKPEDPLPPGAVQFTSIDPSEPRVEAVLSLKRGRPSVDTEFADVHNEVGYAIAMYYGLERSLRPGSFSSRTDVPTRMLFRPATFEWTLARQNMEACDKLAAAALKGHKLVPARPQIHLDPLELDGGNVMQGDQVDLKFQVTNNGNAPLMIKPIPDCSCVAAAIPGPIYAGETQLVKVRVDTTEVSGLFEKSVLVYANDPEKTVYRMPLKLRIKPMYTIVSENDGSVLMQKGGFVQKIFFFPAEGSGIKLTGARFDGLQAKVKFAPWTGRLPGDTPSEQVRSGYKVEVALPDQLPPGRTTGTLYLFTNSPLFKRVYTNLRIQKGIVALPEEVKLGEIPAAPRRASFLISRPKKGFKILKIDVDSPFITAKLEPAANDWEYRVAVQFNGKAAPGPVNALITVRTSDPAQPVIKVPFSAMVR